MELNNSMGILVQYWYSIGILEILVLDRHVGIMALYDRINQGLLLCSELVPKDHGYEIGFQYIILKIDK